MTKWLFAGLES